MSKVQIKEESDIVKARSVAKEMARDLGFGLVDQTRISTAVSELARNIFAYAGEGEVYIETDWDHRKGIRITFTDQGPGIEDIDLALQDGFSTAGSMGKGLPGAKRLMDRLNIQTKPGEGTRIIIEKWLDK
ncbi:anti-sigma regulatory factor [candidate division WOR-3 bacterium]|nr:anti-sigma regulatory factor [candidate division WOR-3 bacterium]